VKNRATRSLTTDEREQIAEIAKDRPSVDIEINFDYRNKDRTRRHASVTALGKRSRTPSSGQHFHPRRSYRRQGPSDEPGPVREARRRVKVTWSTVSDPLRPWSPVGYGKTKLKNESDPFAGETVGSSRQYGRKSVSER
jgi:hypothetical protein